MRYIRYGLLFCLGVISSNCVGRSIAQPRTLANLLKLARYVDKPFDRDLMKQLAPFVLAQGHLHSSDNDAPYVSCFDQERKKFYQALEGRPWGQVAKKYINRLKNEEQQLMNELFALFYFVDEHTWQVINKETSVGLCSTQHAMHTSLEKLEGTSPLGSAINKTFNTCGIAADQVTVVKDEACPLAGVIGLTLGVNYCVCANLMSHVKACDDTCLKIEAVMLHEAQHLLHDDTHTTQVIEMLQKRYNAHNKLLPFKDRVLSLYVDENQLRKLIWRISNFQERRADTLACLVGPQYARGFIKFLEPYVQAEEAKGSVLHDEINEHDHPVVRSAYMQRLYQEMMDEINKDKARRD